MAINPFFNAEYYLARNPDLVRAGLVSDEQLWNHYEQYGAQESTNPGSDRDPNSWFDVNYYLGNYPDLAAAGITAADALNHYYTYGINEDRTFSIKADLNPNKFDAETYAEENADVREYLRIEEGAELTKEQKAELLKHYLSYGYAEGRKGAGADFAKEVEAINVINVGAAGNYQGTIAADEFNITTGTLTGNVLDGLGGNDIAVFNAASSGATLRNIENVEVAVSGAVSFTTETQLNQIKLGAAATTVTAGFANSLVAGSDDVLNVVNNATAGVLTVNGFETVNVALGNEASAAFTLNANKASGDTLAVNLTGGDAALTTLTVKSANSPKLENLNIDGSGLTTGLKAVAIGTDAANIENITVTGSSSAINEFNVTGTTIANTVTVIGGNKADTFTASAAIDVFTGGNGKDTFDFSTANTAAIRTKTVDVDGTPTVVVDAVDTIIDFKKGDKLKLDAAVVKLKVVEFDTSDLVGDVTLEKLLDLTTAETAPFVFEFDEEAYVVIAASTAAGSPAGAQLVKLAGVGVDSFNVVDNEIAGTAGIFELGA